MEWGGFNLRDRPVWEDNRRKTIEGSSKKKIGSNYGRICQN